MQKLFSFSKTFSDCLSCRIKPLRNSLFMSGFKQTNKPVLGIAQAFIFFYFFASDNACAKLKVPVRQPNTKNSSYRFNYSFVAEFGEKEP